MSPSLAGLVGRPVRVRMDRRHPWQVLHVRDVLFAAPECAVIVSEFGDFGEVLPGTLVLWLRTRPDLPTVEVMIITPVDVEVPG